MADENSGGNHLWKALLAFQAEELHLAKDSTNPHFRSKFLSLDALLSEVRPALNRHGIVLTQLPTVVATVPALKTVLTHAESGESLSTTMLLLVAKDDPQGQGSALTYARRYAIQAVLGLVADDDDDGNRASATGVRRARTPLPAAKVAELAQAVKTAGWDDEDVLRTASRKYGREITEWAQLAPVEANEIIEGSRQSVKR